MPTIKLVVIGSSGVGKTSLRGKYISGRFSTGYRATIGADFITKTFPHPTNPEESVTLQIWDTAGQERFSSLSTAFFRGADAAILMFDVNAPETMQALKKWWGDFRDKAPLEDEDMQDYCCVVVGNKIDKGDRLVGESDALEFLDELVPPFPPASPTHTTIPHIEFPRSEQDSSPLSPHRSDSIAIAPQAGPSSLTHRSLSNSRSRSSSRFYSGTMTTSHTSRTVYHTPSSSVFDVFQSARSSPEPWSTPPPTSPSTSMRQRRLTGLSTSSSSAVTITPSLFAREHASETQLTTPDPDFPSSLSALGPPLPHPPERGPKLFFTSAKTGEGVEDVFEYIMNRVVRRWEYEEAMEARIMHFRDAGRLAGDGTADTIRLGLGNGSFLMSRNGMFGGGRGWGDCCAS